MKLWNPKMQSKMSEALAAVVPIIGIVLALSFTVAPVSPGILLSFLMGAVLVMVGMMFFTLGAEISMTPMGEKVGAKMTQTKNVWFIMLLSFILGMTLVPEKEMVFIVVRKSQKNAIMKAIMDEAGTGTKAGAIVFSLPVTDTAGMRMMEEIEEE